MAYHGKNIAPNRRINKMVDIICRPNCKRLIALSECNLNMQLKFYENYGHPEITDILAPKTCTFKVPQEILVESIHPVTTNNVKFVFVGNDFIRKGGREVLDVFREIRKIRNDFQLTLITELDNNFNYAFYQAQDSIEELDEIRNWAKQQEWIHIYTHIPNSQVLDIIKHCDVGLLPTWFDTYGYSVLEMQACGVPVITTNVRALPEINANGWLLTLPTNAHNQLKIDSEATKKQLRRSMQKQMYDLIIYLLDHREYIEAKALSSFDYIRKFHSPSEYSRKLSEIYSEFL